jgi:hypothetical protein
MNVDGIYYPLTLEMPSDSMSFKGTFEMIGRTNHLKAKRIDLFPLFIPSIPSFPHSIPAKVQTGSATFQVALNVDGHKKPHISKYSQLSLNCRYQRIA